MRCVPPDYRNCALNVIASIAGSLGLPLSHPTHPVLDGWLREKRYQNVVLMLFDGMGMDILEKALPQDAFLRRHLGTEMTSCYPSTTPNVTSCVECGVSPREHGWLGWTLYFPQIQKPVDVFVNLSEGKIAADYHVANRFIPRDMIFPRITAAGQAEACCVSRFGDTHIDTLDELFDAVLALCRDDKRRYVYTYWGEPDHTMHEVGCYERTIFEIVKDINARVEQLAESLPEDTLLMITADHGLIDSEFHYLEDAPELYAMLEHDPTIESRAVSFHVKPECRAAFPDAFRKAFGDHFLLMTGEAFIRDYLGGGQTRPNVYDFVGDYMALATDAWCIDTCRGHHSIKGVHGGLTAQEMRVPLIAIKK